MILNLHRQGLSITAIARRIGRDWKTVRKYIARDLEPPAYGPRQAGRTSKLASYHAHLRERVTAFPDLNAVRPDPRVARVRLYGTHATVKWFISAIRTPEAKLHEASFETPLGQRAQVDFARFVVTYMDAPGAA